MTRQKRGTYLRSLSIMSCSTALISIVESLLAAWQLLHSHQLKIGRLLRERTCSMWPVALLLLHHLPSYLASHKPLLFTFHALLHLPSRLRSRLPSCVPSCVPSCLPSCLPPCLSAYCPTLSFTNLISSFVLSSFPLLIPSSLPSSLFSFLPSFLLFLLPLFLRSYIFARPPRRFSLNNCIVRNLCLLYCQTILIVQFESFPSPLNSCFKQTQQKTNKNGKTLFPITNTEKILFFYILLTY